MHADIDVRQRAERSRLRLILRFENRDQHLAHDRPAGIDLLLEIRGAGPIGRDVDEPLH